MSKKQKKTDTRNTELVPCTTPEQCPTVKDGPCEQCPQKVEELKKELREEEFDYDKFYSTSEDLFCRKHLIIGCVALIILAYFLFK